MNTTISENTPRLLYSIVDAGVLLGGLSRAEITRLIGRGELRAVKVGRLTKITHKALMEFCARLEHMSAA